MGKLAFSPREEGNPFRTGSDLFASVGLDLKYGLKSNLTLDLSLNPDFGQVEVDPAEVNLSVFETYYSEKRPFFIEGSNIFAFGYGGANSNWGFNWSNPEFFYSRRVGQPPRGTVDSDGYVNYPEMTTILGAAKVTGKVAGNWNVGFLSALTAREYADVDSPGRPLRPGGRALQRLQRPARPEGVPPGAAGTGLHRHRRLSRPGRTRDCRRS